MTPALDAKHGLLHELRLRAIERGRALGEAGEHIELRDGGRRGLQRRQAGGQPVEQLVVQFLLARQRPVARAEHLVLERLELGGDEPLGGFHGLAPQILLRHPIRLRAVDFDEETLHPIEAELEAGKPGALALAALQVEQILLRVAAQQAKLVQLGVVPRGDHAAVAQQMRRRFGDRSRQQRKFPAMVAELIAEVLQERRGSGRLQPGERVAQHRKGAECRAQLREVTRTRRAQRDARQDSLDVADRAQRLRDLGVARGFDQRRHRVVARLQACRGRAADDAASGATCAPPWRSPSDRKFPQA